MADVNRNNKAYDSGDVEVFINGVSIDVVSITYGTEQEHQLNYTLSNDATSWSRGKKTPSCTMSVMMADITPLELAAPDGDLLKISPFDVIVTFTNEFNVIVTDHLVMKFKSNGRDVNGEMGLKREYEMFVLSVKLNVKNSL